MRVVVKRAIGFRNLVEFFVGFGREVRVQMDDGGGLVLWYGPHVVAEYPRRRAPEGIIRFVLDVEILSMALECVHPKDSLTLEWSGRDTIQMQLTHPSGRSTDIDFPVLRLTEDRPPRVVGTPSIVRRISSATFSVIVDRFTETAVCTDIRVAIFKDGIEFKTEGPARFRMRTWHPTHAQVGGDDKDGPPIVVPTPIMSRVAGLRSVSSVMDFGVCTPTSALVSTKGLDGCIVCVTILIEDRHDDAELDHTQPRPTRI